MEQLGIVGEDSLVHSITSRVSGSATQSWYGDYVFLSLLEKAAEAILEDEKADGASDGLYSVLGFRRRFGEVVAGEGQLIGERDAEILLKFMQRDKGVLVADVKQDVSIICGTTSIRHTDMLLSGGEVHGSVDLTSRARHYSR